MMVGWNRVVTGYDEKWYSGRIWRVNPMEFGVFRDFWDYLLRTVSLWAPIPKPFLGKPSLGVSRIIESIICGKKTLPSLRALCQLSRCPHGFWAPPYDVENSR